MIEPFKPWRDMPLMAFDTETDGPVPTDARVVTACVINISGAEKDVLDWILNTGREIPTEASDIHGVTTEKMQSEGMEYEEGLVSIWAALQLGWGDGRIMVAYNASFDVTIMVSELRRLGIDPGEIGPIADPFTIDRHVDTFRKGSRKLVDVCKHYGLTLENAHSADADALAAARLAYILARRYPEVGKLTAEEFMAQQALWHKSRQLDFIEYLKRQGKPHDDVSTEWPIQARQVDDAA